jgi:ATP-binding cassette subfamily F protein 3
MAVPVPAAPAFSLRSIVKSFGGAAVHEELAGVEAALADPALAQDLDRMAKLLARQARLIDALGEQTVDGDAIRLLRELGLDDADADRPTRTLSGGECKLVALAACLVRRPDLLLLDEPEAHLDMARRSLLESLVADLDGAIVVVSHDRFLLDEVVEQIAEVEHGRVRMWQGGYSAYTVARELELIRRQQAYVTQQKEIARLEDAIRRFKDWAHRVADERHIKQARNSSARSTAWRRCSGRWSSGAEWRWPCGRRHAAASASWSCATSSSTRSSPGSS